jgi:hypothetical protein
MFKHGQFRWSVLLTAADLKVLAVMRNNSWFSGEETGEALAHR